MKEKTLWSGGRLEADLDLDMAQLNNSLDIDQRLAQEDVQGSLAWAAAIHQAGILNAAEFNQIQAGLEAIAAELADGSFVFQASDEDIHTAVERRLTELIGPTGGKLHTGRSRNDQVATDFRLWIKTAADRLSNELQKLQAVILERAENDLDVILPGYTHFQQAQPILLSHWWLSHFWALDRDRERLMEAAARADRCPLGCGALAGTTIPVNREQLAEALGFSSAIPNSLDAVSDRDFVCDFLYWASMLGMHLSRIAEALILYSTLEFGFVTLSDQFSTGSSLMPQKKNPDSLELIRGKSAGQFGRLIAMLGTLKSLPSAYDKDLQEDKKLVFDALDEAALVMRVLQGVIATLTIHPQRCREAINMQALATDAADYLVMKGMPFREAHHVIGKAVKQAETQQIALSALSLDQWRALSPLFNADIADVFSLEHAISQRFGLGGTAREQVNNQLAEAKNKLAK